MPLPRAQLFEFNDSRWAPVAIRESLVEALSRTLVWARVLRGLAGPFASFLDETGAREVLDLCAGAGGPAAILVRELRRAGRAPPRFLLTDLLPHLELWDALRRADPDAIEFVPASVDATAIPRDLGAGRARTIINALHHLPPALAGAVLRGACEEGPGVFVAEVFGRNPLRFPSIAVPGAAALAVTPFLSPRHRLAKSLLLPITFVAAAWDVFASTLRVYTERELREMVAPVGNAFRWSYGTYAFPFGGRGFWFSGVRA